jgi:hypothetical protein
MLKNANSIELAFLLFQNLKFSRFCDSQLSKTQKYMLTNFQIKITISKINRKIYQI